METYEIAFTVILASVGIGLAASIAFSNVQDQNYPTPSQSQEVHEHALFHVVVNGSEEDFTAERFQLNAGDVHLENNKSDIVHKHAEGVTWGQFLNTINTTYWRSNSTGNLCLRIYDQETCGNGEVVLNGQTVEDLEGLDQVIDQGDNLLIVLNSEEGLIEEYMGMELPRAYKPESTTGKAV